MQETSAEAGWLFISVVARSSSCRTSYSLNELKLANTEQNCFALLKPFIVICTTVRILSDLLDYNRRRAIICQFIKIAVLEYCQMCLNCSYAYKMRLLHNNATKKIKIKSFIQNCLWKKKKQNSLNYLFYNIINHNYGFL